MFKMRKLSACISLLMLGGNAFADSEKKADSIQLEEIVVTAQKKSENLQDVPISIKALDSSAIEKSSINTLSDIKSVPGLSILPFFLAQDSTLFMRIRGNQNFPMDVTLDQSVAVHINGIYIARGDGLNMSADLERVEVLNGPQGTLYGRNASSGAVNLITAKPEFDGFHFKQQITFATRGQTLSKTAVNLPISDTFAVRLSYIKQNKDEADNGVKNSGLGAQFGKFGADSYRVDMRWKPDSTVTVDYGYDYGKNKWQDIPFQCLRPSPLTYNPAQCNTNFQEYIPSIAALPDSQSEVSGHTLNINWEITPTTTFRSTTGYRTLKENYYTNMISSPGNFIYTAGPIPSVSGSPGAVLGGGSAVSIPGGSLPNPLNQNQISQEFQLLGTPSEFFNYTVGTYIFQEKANQNRSQFTWLPNQNIPSLGGANSLISYSPAFNVAANNKSWALFGQFSWRPQILNRQLEIIPGVRYTRDSRDVAKMAPGSVTYLVNNPLAMAGFLAAAGVPAGTSLMQLGPQGNAVNYSGQLNFSKTTPSLTVQYHVSDASMIYGKIVKGYRSGGFSLSDTNFVRASQGFAPENITSTELGLKGEFFDRRLRVNGAVFVMDYSDQQMNIATGTGLQYSSGIFNAGKSQTRGFELDLKYAATDRLQLGLSWAGLDLQYKEIIDPDPTSPTFGKNVANRFYREVPKNSYTASVDYRFTNIGLPGKLDAHLEYSHMDKYVDSTIDFNSIAVFSARTGVTPTRADMIQWGTTPASSIWNGRIALNGIQVGPQGQGDLSVGIWGKNLADKKYISFVMGGDAFAGTGGTGFGRWGQRRTIGVDLIYRY